MNSTVTGNLALVADSDVVAQLRALHPKRALEWGEARSVAERQAALLLDLLFVTEPAVPLFVISALPNVQVDWRADWPTSGMSVQADGHWRVVIKTNEPRQRQRFSLAHEFKHILDDPFIDRLFQLRPADERADCAERICNYFAACLLMPRPWIKHDWYGGLQQPSGLARRYYVSTEAMTMRLDELGLKTAPVRRGPTRPLSRKQGAPV